MWIALALAMLAPASLRAAQQHASAGHPVIQDKAEYDAYVAVSNIQDPEDRAKSLAAFVAHYPKSVVLADALEQEIAAWEQAGNESKVAETAKQLVTAEPGNIRALAIVVALTRELATAGDQLAVAEVCSDAPLGAQNLTSWKKPEGMKDSDFVTLRDQMKVIFLGGEGFCALQNRKYSEARDFFTQALKIDAADYENLYQLAVADLEMKPKDVDGFWYCAKSIQLVQKAGNLQAIQSITASCMTRYGAYHGSGEGWDAIVKEAAGQDAPPRHFSSRIKRGQKSE